MRAGHADSQHCDQPVIVVGNGPSSGALVGVQGLTMIVCNRGHEEFAAQHCVAVDRFAVSHMHNSRKPGVVYWTKRGAANLPVPPSWQTLPRETMDSGSSAIALAHHLYPHRNIVCWGFDGVLWGDNQNRYTYPFRSKPTTQSQRQKHLAAIQDLPQHILAKTQFVSPTPHQQLRTIDYDTARKIIETQS